MKEQIRLLLVEDDRHMRQDFRYYIQRNKKIELAAETGKQSEACRILREKDVDAVLLDLELEEGDGIHLLEEIKKLEAERPLVVVITNNRSEVTLGYLHSVGVEFIFQKHNAEYSPLKVLNIIERIFPFRKKRSDSKIQTGKAEKLQRHKVEIVLKDMGFRMAGRSPEYLKEALYLAAYHFQNDDFSMQQIYYMIGEKYHMGYRSVEKAIRDSIERAWIRQEDEKLSMHYPFPVCEKRGIPTNQEFVKNVSKLIRKE